MPTELSKQERINILVKAIRTAIKEIDPTKEIKDEPIAGLIIIQYPADHDKTTELVWTAIGRICISHTFQLVDEIAKIVMLGENHLAS